MSAGTPTPPPADHSNYMPAWPGGSSSPADPARGTAPAPQARWDALVAAMTQVYDRAYLQRIDHDPPEACARHAIETVLRCVSVPASAPAQPCPTCGGPTPCAKAACTLARLKPIADPVVHEAMQAANWRSEGGEPPAQPEGGPAHD